MSESDLSALLPGPVTGRPLRPLSIKALEQETIKGHWIEKGKADIAYDMCGYKSWATKYMQFNCHLLGETALVNLKFGSYHDNGTSGVVYTLTEKVLTETSALTL